MSDSSIRPRSVIASEYASNKSLAHFVLRLRNRTGVLEAVSGVVARNKVNILSGFHETISESESMWSFFGDVTGANVSAAQLADELSRLSMSVLDVKFRVTSLGFIADAFHFPSCLGGRPLVMFTTSCMEAIFRHVREILGTGSAADVIIHQMGLSNGKEMYGAFESRFGKGAPQQVLVEYLHLIRAAGWGCETLTEFDVNRATVRIELDHCVECSIYESSKTPRSQFVRGTYSAFFSGFFGRPVDAEEVRCIACNDNVCEFLLKPQ